jgi:hypothetical protein
MRQNIAMILSCVRYGCLGVHILFSAAVQACESGAVAVFGCDAAKSRKFIELCAPAPLDAQSGYLVYRFGSPASTFSSLRGSSHVIQKRRSAPRACNSSLSGCSVQLRATYSVAA